MAKVQFKRYETDIEAQESDVIDGQFIVTKEGSVFVDYGNERIPTGGLTLTTIFNAVYPVGCYYETSDTNFNPNNSFVGTWVLEEDGTALVSSSSTSGSIFNDTVGTTVGEEKHTLTANEMPSHGHSLTPNNNIYAYNYGGTAETAVPTASDVGKTQGRYYQTISASNTGGGQAHNIVQPSKIVNRWHRTA